jgi:hypothetical protein
MSDEKPPSGFTWGLRPGGTEPEEPTTPASGDSADDSAAERTPAGGGAVDVGHYSVVDSHELSLPGHDAGAGGFDDDDGEPTAAFDFRSPEPPRIDSIETPVYHAGRALPWEQPPAFDPALDGATEALAAEPAGIDRPPGEAASASALDSLFSDDQFHPYDDAAGLALVPPAARAVRPAAIAAALKAKPKPQPKAPRAPRGPMPANQRMLLWIAGALVAALAIAGLFFVGTRIGDASTDMSAATDTSATPAAPSASATPSPDATTDAPAPAGPALGPLAPGVYDWNQLLGTECLDPFVSAWEEQYTVVDCATPHAGQLAFRGRFTESAVDPYPGVEALQGRMNLLCASPENIDYAAASKFSDIQISASFAGTEDDWADGNRNYFCFVSRSSGEPLTLSVAMPARPPVAIPVVPAPEP